MFWDSDDRCDRRIQVELLDQPSGAAPDLRVRVSIDVADVTGSCEAPSSWGGEPEHPFACSVKHLDVVQTPLVITLRANEIRVSHGVVDAATDREAFLRWSIR